MGRMSVDTRQRVIVWWQKGVKVKEIHQRLREEGIRVSITSLWLLVGKFRKTGFIKDLPRASRPSISVREHYEFIDECMAENDELTARCLRSKLQGRFPGFNLSLLTVRRARKDLGWIATTPRYCQLI